MGRYLGYLAMRTLAICALVVSVLAEEQTPQGIVKTFQTNNGYGVASVAGVTSRNGRVSSVSGVNFYPSATNPWAGLNFMMPRSGDKIPEPISFSKEENGKYTAGTIKYGPGSVSVTSVARSIFPEDSTKVVKSKGVQKQSQLRPMSMIYPDPFATLNGRSLSPWFPNFAFNQPAYQSPNSMTNGWPYSNLSPIFKFWQR